VAHDASAGCSLKKRFRPFLCFVFFAVLRVIEAPDKGIAAKEGLLFSSNREETG
jgi:hypothetical protein